MASKKTILIAWFVLGLMAFLIGACGGGDDASTAVPTATQPSPTNTPTVPPTALPTATLAPTGTTAATATPAPTPAPVELSPSQVFSRVSPSIAFVSTPTTFGSAILIDDGYLLTNSHVVYGFREVRIVFQMVQSSSMFLFSPLTTCWIWRFSDQSIRILTHWDSTAGKIWTSVAKSIW